MSHKNALVYIFFLFFLQSVMQCLARLTRFEWEDFVFKNPRIPYSRVVKTPHPPPPPHHPLEMKSWPGPGTLSFDYPRIPCLPWKLKFGPSFDYPRITPPPHWNLARTWHFDFWLPQITPPLLWKIEIWPGLGTLSFDYCSIRGVQGAHMWRLISVSPHGYHFVNLVERIGGVVLSDVLHRLRSTCFEVVYLT